jgi:hypothetical protein
MGAPLSRPSWAYSSWASSALWFFYPTTYDLSKAEVNIGFGGDSITASAAIRVETPVSEPAGETPEEEDNYKVIIPNLIGDTWIIDSLTYLHTKISYIFRHVAYNKSNATWEYCRSKFLEDDMEKLDIKEKADPSLPIYDLSVNERILISVSSVIVYLTVIILSVFIREYQEKNKQQAMKKTKRMKNFDDIEESVECDFL